MRRKKTAIEKLESVLDDAAVQRGLDWGIECDVSSECAWGMTVRITFRPNAPDKQPDESIVLHTVGGQSPEHLARKILPAVREVLSRPAPAELERDA